MKDISTITTSPQYLIDNKGLCDHNKLKDKYHRQFGEWRGE